MAPNEKTLSELAQEYADAWIMNFLDQEQLKKLFLEAANEVYGWGDLTVHNRRYEQNPIDGCPVLVANDALVTENTPLTESDWVIIRPLAMYFAELETAKLLEASKNHNLEQHGRTSSEIENDIQQYRELLHKKSFSVDPITI